MISRMYAGHVDLDLAECNVFEILQQCANLLDVLAQEKGQLLTVGSSGDGTIQADEMLRTIGRHNEVQAKGVPSMGVEITVDNQGPGIPEESQKKVFERFYHVSPGQTGAGLGLPIAKWIVEAHYGAIWVSACTSGGSRFTVRLPNHPLENGAYGYPRANYVSGFAGAKP